MTLDDYVSTKTTAAAEFVSPTGLMGTRSVYDHLGRVVRTERLHNVVLTMSAPDDVTAGLFASSVTSTGSLAWSSQTVYNQLGQVSRTVAADGQVTDYEYDALGRQTATGYEQTVQEVHKDTSGAVTKTIDYTIGMDEISQTVIETGQSVEKHVFHHDGHGAVRVLTDLAGAVLEIYSFDAYGNAWSFDTATALTSILSRGKVSTLISASSTCEQGGTTRRRAV